MSTEDIAVLYSGGTDSTLAAAISAERFRKIYLVTYDRFGLFETENTRGAAQDLMTRFGEDRIHHDILRYDGLFRFTSYENYLANLYKHRFFLLSTCGLCKLAMHVRTIVYCIDNKIQHACDGANKGMDLFPAQMDCVLKELKKLYGRFGISYSNPVFNYEPPEEDDFIEKENLALIQPARQRAGAGADTGAVRVDTLKTAGKRLRKMKLAPSDNVKGTTYDRGRQPRCFQFMLFNVFAKKYYLADHSTEEYKAATLSMIRDKIKRFETLLAEYQESGANEELLKS